MFIDTIDTAIDVLNHNLESICVWLLLNSPIPNPTKSELLILYNSGLVRRTLSATTFSVTIGRELVKVVDFARSLRLVLDSQLNLCQHVNRKLKACSCKL